MKKIFILFVLCLAFLHAQNGGIIKSTKIKTMDGVGQGVTREDAVNNAIVEALGKMQGINISSSKFVNTTSIESDKASSLKDIYSQKISKITSGRVDGYKINSVENIDGMYEASVSVKKILRKTSYKTPGFSPNSRRKIAVFPTYSTNATYDVLGSEFEASIIADKLTQEVVSAITQTRKFSVLDREATAVYESEKSLILQNSPKDELVKIGKVLGTDYMYVLNIDDFGISSQKSELLSGDDVLTHASVDYRIIVMATRQIKYSNSKTFSFQSKGENANAMVKNSAKFIARALTDDIINNIYPQKIISVNSGEVILSTKLNLGDEYDVFALGKKMFDPYTKEQIGYTEEKIGTIKITRVTPKMSYAKIIAGKANKGNICRLVSESFNGGDITEEQKPSDVKIKQGGGVVLPFD